MSRQMEGYQEMLEIIEKKYPGRAFLSVKEASEILGVNVKTVSAAIRKKYNGLNARNVSAGLHNKMYRIAVPEIIRWGLGRR